MENITLSHFYRTPARGYALEKPSDGQTQTEPAQQTAAEEVLSALEPAGADALTAAQLARAQAFSAAAQDGDGAAPNGAAQSDDMGPLQSLVAQKDAELKNMFDMLEEMRKKAEEMRNKLKLPKNSSRYGFAAIEAYSRLSRARTKSQVSSAAGYARLQLSQMQTALRQDPDNAGRIRAAIRQLQGAVTRAGRKKRELEDERIAEIRRKRAEKEHRPGRAHRIEQETRRKQAVRRVRESGYVSSACIAMIEQEHIEQQRAAQREQLEKIAGLGGTSDGTPAIAVPTGGAVTDAVQAYSAQAAPAAPMPAPAVQVEI